MFAPEQGSIKKVLVADPPTECAPQSPIESVPTREINYAPGFSIFLSESSESVQFKSGAMGYTNVLVNAGGDIVSPGHDARCRVSGFIKFVLQGDVIVLPENLVDATRQELEPNAHLTERLTHSHTSVHNPAQRLMAALALQKVGGVIYTGVITSRLSKDNKYEDISCAFVGWAEPTVLRIPLIPETPHAAPSMYAEMLGPDYWTP